MTDTGGGFGGGDWSSGGGFGGGGWDTGGGFGGGQTGPVTGPSTLAGVLMPGFRWLVSGVVIKFVTFLVLFYLVTLATGYMMEELLPKDDGGLKQQLQGLPPGVWFYILLFKLDVGIPMILSAMVTAFTIRRLPVIG